MIVVVIASLMFGSLLSPPLLLLLAVGWLFGAHAMLLIPIGVWALATVWLSANAGVRGTAQALESVAVAVTGVVARRARRSAAGCLAATAR